MPVSQLVYISPLSCMHICTLVQTELIFEFTNILLEVYILWFREGKMRSWEVTRKVNETCMRESSFSCVVYTRQTQVIWFSDQKKYLYLCLFCLKEKKNKNRQHSKSSASSFDSFFSVNINILAYLFVIFMMRRHLLR